MERFDTLTSMVHDCWHLIFRASVSRNDPMRTPVLGTVKDGVCRMRTVVLRKVEIEKNSLYFFTDVRSEKVTELRNDKRLSCLFYHPRRKVQIRARGQAFLHYQDERAESFWKGLPVSGRKDYGADHPPGTLIRDPDAAYFSQWEEDPDAEQTAYAYRNFLVLQMLVDSMDCLHLHREGHQRASFLWEGEEWKGQWLVP